MIAFFLVGLGNSTCLSVAWCQQRPRRPVAFTRLSGQVRSAHGPAGPQGVLITLEGQNSGMVARTQTDQQGKFAFDQIPMEIYIVNARQPGYRDTSERVDLTMTPTNFVMLTLEPLSREEPRALPPEGPNATISIGAISVPEKARKEFQKGQKLLRESNDPTRSLPHFLRAIQSHPSYAQAHLLLGSAYMDLNKLKDAQAALEKAVELNEKLPGAYLALGTCHSQQGNFAAAEKPLLRGLELEPNSVEGQYELGKVYWALGRWQDAEPHARKAAALKPEFAPVHVLLGNILLRKRDAAAALLEFKEYLRLEPSGPFAESTRSMVTKIERAIATPH